MGSARLAFYLALKNTFSRPSIFLLVILIIGVTFANLLFVSGIFSGMTQAMNSGVKNSAYSNIIIEPYGDTQYLESAQSTLNKIESVPGVIRATRRISVSATLIHPHHTVNRTVSPVLLFGIDPEREAEMSNLPQHMPDGSYLEPSDSGKILLGADIANAHYQSLTPEEDTLGIESGEHVTVFFRNGLIRDYEVKGVFYSKALLADYSAFIPLSDAEDIVGRKDVATQILVKVPDGTEDAYIQKLRGLGIAGNFYTWKEKGSYVNFITQTFDVIEAIVTLFCLVAAASAIFIILYIHITQRKKQIGILKAVGIRNGVVLFAHVFQAMLYGVFGIIAGLALFNLIAMYFASHPLATALGDAVPYLEPSVLTMDSLLMFAVCIIGGFAPAYYASRENIIRSIWG